VVVAGILRAALVVLTAALLAGCAAAVARNPVPVLAYESASVPGYPTVRYWGDALPPRLDEVIAERASQIRATRPGLLHGEQRRISYLALSGGGSDGAFGAGLLVGWSKSGARPEFEIVTGISTGALIAPFAFLGSDYDDRLSTLYTSYGTSQLLTPQVVTGLLGGIAITNTSKLEELIASYVDEAMVQAIAREHRKGRRLLVGTTNLDAQRPVIWDLGAIAASGRFDAPGLIRNVLLASAAIPGVFPPVFINVETGDGAGHEEMHVDGGTTAEVFFLPAQVLTAGHASVSSRIERELYVISNGKIGTEFEPVRPTTISIAARSLQTLIRAQWRGDLLRLHLETSGAGIGFNLAAVPEDFDLKSAEPFDVEYMRELFARGLAEGSQGITWLRSAPDVAVADSQ
jgi:predicted acylesterase/phospholipase RssA